MKILVTGHMGLIGQAIYNKLKVKHTVYGIDKVKDKSVRTCIQHTPPVDMIIHCAANCVIREVIEHPHLAFENMDSTIAVLEHARITNIKKVILFSSSRVNHDNFNPYTVSKRLLEDMAKAYKECYGIDYIIIRPETVWGMNDNPTRVIPRWIKLALENKPIEIYGDKNKEMPPIYIDDFMDEFMYFFEGFNDFKTDMYMINGKPLKAKEIAETIIRVTKSKSKIKFKKAEKSQPQECFNTCYGMSSFEDRLTEVLK